MSTAEVQDYLAHGIEIMGLQLHNRAAVSAHLSRYFHELKKWNRKVNLVARTLTEQQILENHFLDSLTLQVLFDRQDIAAETLLDVGTGAGFPGLVLKAALPLRQAVLIEPRRNRYYFLKHIVRILDLKEVEVLNTRLDEDVVPEELSGRRFTVITSRAFTDIDRFVRLTEPYLADDGRIVSMKGPGADKELASLKKERLSENFYVSELRRLQLPYSRAERTLVSIRRVGAD
jgi:16S rRNA (guanine527-N7)-methyltransferase